MEFYEKDQEHTKIYSELMDKSQVNVYDEFYKFGVATELASFTDWVNTIEKRGIKQVAVNEMRKYFIEVYSNADAKVKEIYERLMKDYE